MRNLLFLYFIFFTFLTQAQNDINEIKVLRDKISEYEKLGDTVNKNYLIECNNLAHLYEDNKNYSQAEKIFQKTLKIRQNLVGSNHLDVATSLIHLSDLYYAQAKYAAAEPFCVKSLNIRSELLSEKNVVYIVTLGKLASIYVAQGKYKQAEILYLKGLKLKKEIYNENDSSIILTLKNLTSLYISQGKYLEAEQYLLNISEIKKTTLGEKSDDYLTALNNLAVAYFYQGKYSDSESLQKNIIKLKKETSGEKNIDFVASLNNLAELYRAQNKFEKAEILYEKGLDILAEINKTDDDIYFISLSNLALLYTQTGYNKEAEPILLKILNWTEKKYGIESEKYASALNNIGNLYFYQKKFNDADVNLTKVVEIRKKVLGKNHPIYALSLHNLASLYSSLNQANKSLPLNLESFRIRKEVLGNNHLDYIESLYALAGNYQDLNSDYNGSLYYNQFLKAYYSRFVKDSFGLSEEEIIYNLKIYNGDLIRPYSFLNDFSKNYSEIHLNLYNNLISINNLSQRNRAQITKSINKTDNQSLKNKYKEFITNKIQLNKLNELPIEQRPENFNILIERTEQLEKELSKESISFSNYQNAMSIKFEDVKNKLTNSEAALNLVSFRYFNKKATDTIIYAAFLIKKNSKFPKFISLFEEKQLEFLLNRNKSQHDSTRIDRQYTDKSISNLFLKPLEKELEGISTIYLSPSDLGHQIDFAALPLSYNQTFGEKFKLHILNSPAELVDYKVSSLDKKSSVELLLYGGINYNNYSLKNEITAETVEEDNDIPALKTRSGKKKFGYLPNTNIEISQIQLKGVENGFATTILNEDKATEESIKALDGRTNPFVLHLATHGFFFADPPQEIPNDILLERGKSKIYKTSDDPMMRSGLLFAGANNFWSKTNLTTTTDDGILTANEISNLDLNACQLVVLSACETGLGEVKGSEGVFGLQRALKMAGVKNIIMSLWKVPDTQTAELFNIFYGECFAGKTIHEAFQTAQSKMKARYSPYYWAGFVLLE